MSIISQQCFESASQQGKPSRVQAADGLLFAENLIERGVLGAVLACGRFFQPEPAQLAASVSMFEQMSFTSIQKCPSRKFLRLPNNFARRL